MLNLRKKDSESYENGAVAPTPVINTDAELELFKAMLDCIPVNVMMADVQTLEITYVNKTSVDTLKSLEHLLPVKVADLVGTCIDVFHKDPSHQRRMLADPSNLPHQAIIQVGEEKLDLLVSAIYDRDGNYVAPVVTWSIVTEKLKTEAATERLMNMLDEMPINVIAADAETLEINYINKTSIDTLRPLQSLLPVPVDQLMGQCIDIFHKNPAHQRTLLADPSNLPHSAKIQLAEHTLDLRVSAITDKSGAYLGPMVSWSVVTEQVKMIDDFETNVKTVIDQVSAASEEMRATSQSMAEMADDAAGKTTTVAAASEEATANVQTVAAAAEELSSSITEIGRQVAQSSEIAQEAVAEAQRTNETVQGLAEASGKIGAVVDLINDIASQTNLLALNATIEAARAGEAGKGFAVVASEVKNLAGQTGSATEEIAGQIDAIQEATSGAVTAIEGIGTTIDKINEIAGAIAAAVEEQGSATEEISRNVQEAATGTQQVTENITSVTESTTETGSSAREVLDAAGELTQFASTLAEESDKFLEAIKKL